MEELDKILMSMVGKSVNESKDLIMQWHTIAIAKAQDDAFKAGYVRGGIDTLNNQKEAV